jgi:CHAT domain-containing protein
MLGARATEAALRQAAPGRRLLHLATHGFVEDEPPTALRPVRGDQARFLGADYERQLARGDPRLLAGLALAGGDGEDGILTALDASHLDLRGLDLVVLSACDTARGKSAPGEGVLGLVRSFRLAGARNVVASLWPVDDEATRMWMERFYEGIARGTDAPAALRDASAWLRSQKRADGRSLDAPRFWAGFVCYTRR